MSKKLVRKGLALGTSLSFALAGLSALPAVADDQGAVTLVPEYGKSFNGVTDTDFTLSTRLDDDINDGAEKLSYLIENPNKAEMSFSFDTYDYNYDGGTSDLDIYLFEAKNGNFFDNEDDEFDTVDYSSFVIQAPSAVDTDATNDYDYQNLLNIYAEQDEDILGVKVTAWVDRDGDKVVDSGEQKSTTETVNLYDPSTLTAVATIDSRDLEVGDSYVEADVVLSNNVNINYVDSNDWMVAVQKNGRSEALADEAYDATYDSGDGEDNALGADLDNDYNSNSTLNLFQHTIDLNSNVDVGNYSVRVGYVDNANADEWTWASPRSAIYSVTKGTNADVDGFRVTTPAANAYGFYEDFALRAGAKDITYTAQAVDSEGEAVESSNIKVKVAVEIDDNEDWSNGAKLSVTGSSKVITDDSEEIVVFGRTDASGKFTFTVSNSAANDGDQYDVYVEYLTTTGTWDYNYYYDNEIGGDSYSEDYLDNWYESAVVSSFDFSKDILSGSSVSATLEAKDQFGQAISSLGGKELKVELVDSDDDTKLKKSATLSSGKATFTWTNYLAKGDTASVDATLYTGTSSSNVVTLYYNDDDWNELTSDGYAEANATTYNPEATGEVIADVEATGEVTYSDYVIGDSWSTDNDADTVAPVSGDAYRHHVVISDTNGAGLPAAVVTVSGKGLLFEDDADAGTFYADSITVVASATGEIDVNVWAHKVGDIVITTTSGGKSATTTLTTELNDSLTVDDVMVSWNAPKHPAVNKLYVVTTNVTDKWGNALPGASLEFNTDGSLQVNGDDQKLKDANSYGKATVYVGGVKNLSGPGSITVQITDLEIPADSIEGGALDLSSTIEDGENTSLTQEVLVGTDAAAKAGKKKGVLRVNAWNAQGKTVKVYVAGKLVATRTPSVSSALIRLTGQGKGTKKVTVKVAGGTYFSETVTIK